MKHIYLVLVFGALGLTSFAQQNVTGLYELFDDSNSSYDTLSSGLVVKKRIVLQKTLELRGDSSFENKHLQPVGYVASLDYSGTWSQEGGQVILNYSVVEEDDHGQEFTVNKKDTFSIEGNSLLFVTEDKRTLIYNKIE